MPDATRAFRRRLPDCLDRVDTVLGEPNVACRNRFNGRNGACSLSCLHA